MNSVAQEYKLGSLYHEPDGAVYKYGKIDFGSLGVDTETNEEILHIDYAWFPWNPPARAKGLRFTID